MFLLNSRLGLFTAPRRSGGPFSRSYRTILPNSLAAAHPSVLGYSPHPSVSIYGTDCLSLALEVFLGSVIGTTIHLAEALWYYRSSVHQRICLLNQHLLSFNVHIRQHASLTFLRYPFETIKSTGILTSLPSGFPFG